VEKLRSASQGEPCLSRPSLPLFPGRRFLLRRGSRPRWILPAPPAGWTASGGLAEGSITATSPAPIIEPTGPESTGRPASQDHQARASAVKKKKKKKKRISVLPPAVQTSRLWAGISTARHHEEREANSHRVAIANWSHWLNPNRLAKQEEGERAKGEASDKRGLEPPELRPGQSRNEKTKGREQLHNSPNIFHLAPSTHSELTQQESSQPHTQAQPRRPPAARRQRAGTHMPGHRPRACTAV